MGASSHIRRLAVLTIATVVIAASTLAILHHRAHHSIAQVVAKQTTTLRANQPSQPQPQPQTQVSTSVPDEPTTFASIVASEVSQLQDGITLAKWMAARGTPEVWNKRPEEEVTATQSPGPECRSYMKVDTLPSGATIVRLLYFYPPPIPSPALFPTLSGRDLIDTCIAAMVEITAEATTSEGDHALDQAVRQRLSKQYGESVGTNDMRFWERGLDRSADRWIDANNKEIIAGYDAQGLDVFVHVRLPMLGGMPRALPQDSQYLATEIAQFHRAVALAGVDGALSGRLEKLYGQVCEAGASPEMAQRAGEWRGSLLPILQDWFSALKTAPPTRRAAGLLAADRVLEEAGSAGEIPGWPEGSKKQSGLEELGAVFERNVSTGDYLYTSNWEKQARELDPDGEVGQMATLGIMAHAWCDADGSNVFEQVIHDGEGLLSKNLDPPTAARVHFMVGDAYSDIVAIAGGESGANGEYDSGQFQNEADSSRENALDHYRAGLAIDNTSENARRAWTQAWHLAAGLLPNERYVCFGD